jgi:hypothetical protein
MCLQGIFFVQVADGVVVIKPSRTVANELFANLCALALGVHTPQWRLVRMAGEGEVAAMHAALSRTDPTWSAHTAPLPRPTHADSSVYVAP